MQFLKHFLTSLLVLPLLTPASAQSGGDGQKDSVVVLMNAQSIQLLEEDGQSFRKTIQARFLHNNTYLICDTALWNVEKEVINAYGHVQILQDQTVLTSDELEYVIKTSQARFRGSLVQLQDKEGNILRTRFLDYNTKDSTAFFERGASMKDKSGQVIESDIGSYDSKSGMFSFFRRVNMYSDSVFISTNQLEYHTATETAHFINKLDAWKDDNMISSDKGFYNKAQELFFFEDQVHMMSPTQEGWTDSLYFNRLSNDLDMRGNVQVTDTTRQVSGLTDRLQYRDSLSQLTMTGNATVIARTDQGGTVDTVYFGADRLRYWTVPKCDLPKGTLESGESRLSILRSDPVAEYRKKAAEEAAKAAEQAAEANGPAGARPGNTPVGNRARQTDVGSLKIDNDAAASQAAPAPQQQGQEPSEELQPAADSLAAPVVLTREDSLRMHRDSLRNRDTTAIGFLTALGRVRVFKKDMQMACDSLEYTDIDSVARLYVSPLVWNEGNRQYSADSIYLGIKNQKMDRANLMSNAFIVIEEQPDLCYDQIRSAEISAYFDTATVLTRFDALGGADALFYLEENEELATVNKVATKMMSARFLDGAIDKLYYFDSPKNDAYPVVQLPEDEKRMKGFIWSPELRPKGPSDITSLSLRESQRAEYLERPMCRFIETDRYFPGHIESIQKMLASQDSIRQARRLEAQRRERALRDSIAMETALNPERGLADSLAATPEELALMDTLAVIADAHLGTGLTDSLGIRAAVDSMAAADSLSAADTLAAGDTLGRAVSIAELRAAREAEKRHRAEAVAQKKAEVEARRQARADAKEARWAELDRRDAEKAAKKEAKALEKRRKRTLEAVLAADKTAAKDQARLMRYVEKYRSRKDAADARKTKRKAGAEALEEAITEESIIQ